MPLRFIFIDFNAYFASVEQQLRPELRGKPVAVVPVMTDSTSCIAASYEAKKYGVKTGTGVKEAKRLCRDLAIVQARTPIYVEYHHKLLQAVDSCIPIQHVFSIDEMACELSGSQQERGNALALARRIKVTIAENVGSELRCSIGIAPNLYLSKTATDMQKPDGLVVIEPGDLPDCLFDLQLEDLTGIGRKMKPRLERSGITTVRDLCNADKRLLHSVWHGIEGERMYARLRGETVYTPPTSRSSVGHSHVLPPKLRTERSALSVLNRLVQKAAMRLRKYGYAAGSLRLVVRYLNNQRWSSEISFDETQDSLTLIGALTTLWNKKPKFTAKPIAVGVTLLKLQEEQTRSRSLFDNEKSTAFNLAIDHLNTRYGTNTVFFGGAFDTLESAPTRIAFTHIPDYD